MSPERDRAGQTRDIASNENWNLTVTTPWTMIPDATSAYVLRIDHPNTSSTYELTNRDAYRAMFFTGEEDLGACSSSTPIGFDPDLLIDETKSWAVDEWNGGYVVVIYNDGTAATRTIYDTDVHELELYAPLPRPLTEADRYVVVSEAKMRLEGGMPIVPALATVWQVLNEGMEVSFPAPRDPNPISQHPEYAIASESQLIHKIIWGESGVVATMKEALGGIDVMRVPALYVGQIKPPSGGKPETIVRADAFVPGMVNFLCTLDTCGNAQVIMPAPFGPSKSLNGAGDDVFADYVDGVLQAEHTLTQGIYLDDWDLYHRRCGETHCGTNSRRAIPDTLWWEV